jgi:surfeit locus 1 family protein
MSVLATLRRMRLVWPTVMTAIALPILIGLGTWQLERKAWKEGLIGAIAERTRAEPADLPGAYAATYEPPFDVAGYEYVRVKVRGRFHHDKERYLYAPDQKLGPGIHVVTPFEMAAGGAVLLVNRGFVPAPLKDPETRKDGLLDGDVEVVGLLRAPQQQARFTPDNDAKANLWFWRDFPGMIRSAFENTERPTIPVFLDAEAPAPGGWPRGGATLINLPNRHLEYAITWFGLAGALAAVYAAFVMQRVRGS